ncbi:MAG: SpaH/EbpB family LPXTG-anchored major pilin [Gemmiger sp.]|uniref:SpaH/EbpB family LPXTG-anchored major pilin n=1 Tax=Gemmiger sp. TaxID=2049027 RepID=UPI00300EC6D7
MKKKSRFLTGLLSAVMALSLFALPAMAAEGTTNVDTSKVNTPQKTTSVIDTKKKGSITIYKYLHADDGQTATPTGEKQETPKNNSPLPGAGFTIYEVKNATWLETYYNGKEQTSDDYKMPVIDDFFEKDETGKVKSYEAKDLTESTKNAQIGKETFTKNDGSAQFTNLDLGLYLVVETTQPQAVVKAVTPFLISIPMTRVKTDNGDENQLKEWLYDVVVYPKNSTSRGEVIIDKKGVVGDKDATEKEALNNVTFDLERLDDSQNPAVWVKEKTNLVTGTAAEGVTAVAGQIKVTGLNTGSYRFVETANDNKNYIVDESKYYYFNIDDKGQVVIPDDYKNDPDYDNKNGTLTIYNYKPDLDKEVLKRGGDKEDPNDWVEATDYKAGATIPYKVTVTVPANITKLGTFKVTDTPMHQTDNIDADKIHVYHYNGTEIDNSKYAVVRDNTQKGFVLTFNNPREDLAGDAGKTITIRYKATLDKDAMTTIDGNPNTVELEYTNKIGSDGQPAGDSTDKIHDDAIVYTFAVNIVKTAADKNTPLPGVEFDLYEEVAEKTEGTVQGSTIGMTGANAGKYYKLVKHLTTNGEGKVSASGLEKGTYYLVETKTAEGYNLLKEPVKVDLNFEYSETWNERNEYVEGALVKHDVNYKRQEAFEAGSTNATELTSGSITANIINRKGFDLPTTGGFGTLLFSAIGALLVVGGVGVLMSTKKKKGNG